MLAILVPIRNKGLSVTLNSNHGYLMLWKRLGVVTRVTAHCKLVNSDPTEPPSNPTNLSTSALFMLKIFS